MIKELINFPTPIFVLLKHLSHVLRPSLLLRAFMKQQMFMGNLINCLAFSPLFFKKIVIIFSFILFFMNFSKLTYFGFCLAQPGQKFLLLFGAPGVYQLILYIK